MAGEPGDGLLAWKADERLWVEVKVEAEDHRGVGTKPPGAVQLRPFWPLREYHPAPLMKAEGGGGPAHDPSRVAGTDT